MKTEQILKKDTKEAYKAIMFWSWLSSSGIMPESWLFERSLKHSKHEE